MPSGDRYRFKELHTTNVNRDGASELTSVGQVEAVSQGPDDNSATFALVHVTINANGEITAVVDNADSDCRG